MEKFIPRNVVDLVRRIRDRRVSRISPDLPEVSAVVDSDAIDRVALDVIQVADTNTLSVLIRDPKNPHQYWYRKIQIKRSGTQDVGDGKQIPYVDFAKIPLINPLNPWNSPEYSPAPESAFEEVLQWIVNGEKELSVHPDPKLRSLYASVAVAKYHGQDDITIDSLLALTAVKFSRMRTNRRR